MKAWRCCFYLIIVFMISFGLISCSESDTPDETASTSKSESFRFTVYAVNYPLAYFAQRIGGEHVDVVFPAPSDTDPAFWMPDAETIAAYQGADLILLNGANYAKWVPKVSLPQSKLIDTSHNFGDQLIVTEDAVTHSHGPGGEHAHTGTAFTTWIDFSQASQQARAITDAFVQRRPAHKVVFEKNFSELEKDLLSLDEAIKEIVANRREQPLVASHPVYQYFNRRYELNIKSVMWEPEEVPGEPLWKELRSGLEKHPAKWMIWEGAPNPVSVDRLLAMGVSSTVFDPCGNRPEHGDFLSVMRRNIENLDPVFE